jgi:hypothetical protein
MLNACLASGKGLFPKRGKGKRTFFVHMMLRKREAAFIRMKNTI